MSTPVPSTASVAPPPSRAPRWAAASMPLARPLTTTAPAAARSAASRSATAAPYGVGRREPTIATRGPSGGGQQPRTWSPGSGGAFMLEQPVAEGFQEVPLGDSLLSVEVGGRPGHPPGPMEAAGGHSPLFGPA